MFSQSKMYFCLEYSQVESQIIKWAQDNNDLRAELVKTEQVAIDAKLQVADLHEQNEQLKHRMYENTKKLKSYYDYIEKLKKKANSSMSTTDVIKDL